MPAAVLGKQSEGRELITPGATFRASQVAQKATRLTKSASADWVEPPSVLRFAPCAAPSPPGHDTCGAMLLPHLALHSIGFAVVKGHA